MKNSIAVFVVAAAAAGQALAQPTTVPGVPDWHQPCLIVPPNGPDGGGAPAPGTPNYAAWCTPTAAANLMGFWQDLRRFPVADGAPFVSGNVVVWAPPVPANWQDNCADATSIPIKASFVARPVGSDLGWYLNTNDQGDQFGIPNNGGAPVGEQFAGTKRINIPPGLTNYLTSRGQPLAKVTIGGVNSIPLAWIDITTEVNAGRPLLGEFNHFNLIAGPLASGVYYWGATATSDSQTGEVWDPGQGLGHTTTIVGYYAAGAVGNPFNAIPPVNSTNAIIIQDSRRYLVPPAPGFPEADNAIRQMILPFSAAVVPPGVAATPWAQDVMLDLCNPINGTVGGGGAICAGGSTTVTVTIVGGNPPYTVTLTNSGGTQTGPSPLTFNVSPAVVTNYAVASGSDFNSCPLTGVGSVNVTINPLPATPVSPSATPAAVCAGNSSVLAATVGAGETMDWYTATCGGTPVPGGASPTVTPAGTTTYYGRARNIATGCVSALCAQATVTVNANPGTPTSAAATPAAICAGGSSVLSAIVPGGQTIDWYTVSCGGTPVPGGASPTVSPGVTTTYYGRARDTATGCVGAACAQATVSVNSLPGTPTGAAATPPAVCLGSSATLSATVPGGQTIDWFTASCGGTPVPGGASPVVTPGATTTYYARARQTGTGCVGTSCAQVTVTVNSIPAAPTGPAATPSTVCFGSTSVLSASVPGGQTVDWYSVSCGGATVPGGASPTVGPSVTTTYYARARDTSSGCAGATCAQVTVTVIPTPLAPSSASADANNYCSTSVANITLSAVGGSGSTLRWFAGSCGGTSIGTGVSLVIPAPLATTTYYARWESSGCTPSLCASITVNVNPVTGACCTGYGLGKACAVTTPAGCAGSTSPSLAYRGDCTTCTSTSCCPADYNNNGLMSVSDIFAFLTDWFGSAASADFNNSGAPPTVSDIFAFLTRWFAGC